MAEKTHSSSLTKSKLRNMPKRISINESQYDGFLKQFEVENGENTAQEISNMRHERAEITKSELKQMAHRYIDMAFNLGKKYVNELDQEAQMLILKKIDKMNKKLETAFI